METDLDHIHILLECSPQHFIPNILKIFKGISARKLFKTSWDKNKLWNGHLWNPSYFVATVSENTEEQIKRYIQTQKERWEGGTMANYVLTLALKTELWQEHILEKRLNIARMIYNSCLSEILKRHRKMIISYEYKEISNLDKKSNLKDIKNYIKIFNI